MYCFYKIDVKRLLPLISLDLKQSLISSFLEAFCKNFPGLVIIVSS